MKNPLTPAGIEPTTFRFVAQHIKHCATVVPTLMIILYRIIYCVAFSDNCIQPDDGQK